jgi:hypothetical protein
MKKKDIQSIVMQGMSFISTLVNALIPEEEGEEDDKKRDTSNDRAETEQH